MSPVASSAVPRKASAPARIVDACVYESSLRFRLGLSHPPHDPHNGATPDETGQEAEGFADTIEAMNRAGVRAALTVLDSEVEGFLQYRTRHAGRLYGWAPYDSLRPERGLEAVRALCEGHAEAFLGVATAFPCFGQDPRLKAFAPFYAYCIQHGLPVLFRLNGGLRDGAAVRPLAFGVLATVYPRLRIVCLQENAGEGDELRELLPRFPNLFLATSLDPGRGDVPDTRALIRDVGSRKIMFASGGRETTASYDRAMKALSQLRWWHRGNVGWRAAGRVFGPRIAGS